jgi:large subunit ribosomal protein L23
MATKKIAKESKEISKTVKISGVHRLTQILLSPRVTEKASDKAMNDNVYIFNVAPSSTKSQIRNAVIESYKVTPTKIGVVTIPRKSTLSRGKKGFRAGGKKALVYLKKGDKIEFV